MPSSDPDAFTKSSGSKVPGGSNVGLIRDPFSSPDPVALRGVLVAATSGVPIGTLDNLRFASGYNYLFAAYRGASAVFVYNLVNLIHQIEATRQLAPERAGRMSRFAIERLDPNPGPTLSDPLPLQEDLQLVNTGVDIKADYRVIFANVNSGLFVVGIPRLYDASGQLAQDANGNQLFSPNAPIATGSTPQGLDALHTDVMPGPLILRQFDYGRAGGVASRGDFGLKDPLDDLLKGTDCNEATATSQVQYDTGALIEKHELVTYSSLGQQQGLVLTYDSLRADPRPIINFGFDDASGANTWMAQLTLTSESGVTIPGQWQMWSVPSGATEINMALQADLSNAPSGYYTYKIASFNGAGTRYGESGGTLLSINGINSAFGRGWGIAGLQELFVGNDNSITIADGDGNEQRFDRTPTPENINAGCEPPTAVYTSMAGDRSIVKEITAPAQSGGGPGSIIAFERTMADGTVYHFSNSGPNRGKLESVRDRYGNETKYGYDNNGLLSSITDPVGLTTHLMNDGKYIRTITDPMGRVTKLDYDSDGNLTRITDPDGSKRVFGYDAQGHLTSETTKLGGHETVVYGAHGRVLEAHRADGSVIELEAQQIQALYTPSQTLNFVNPPPAFTAGVENLTAKYTDAAGNVHIIKMNERGQVLKETDSLGLLHEYERDDAGNVLVSRNHHGHDVVSTYDERGNRLTMRDAESPAGQSTVMTYDGTFNRVTSVTDELGQVTQYDLSAKGDILQTAMPDGSTRSYTYTPQGLMSSQTDELGRTTTYSYDSKGRLKTVSNADGSHRSYEYDAAGNTQAVIDENGNRTDYTHDVMGRVLTARLADPDGAVGPQQRALSKFTYDAAGNQLSATDARGNTTQFTYDVAGRLTSQKNALGGARQMTYDDSGNVKTVTDALGRKTEFFYDLRNRNTSRVDAEGKTTQYQHHAGGLPEAVVDALGRRTEYGYDARERLVTETDALGHTVTRTYDAANNLQSVTNELGHATTFGYDERNRRIRMTDALGNVTQTQYDAAGNVVATIDALGRATTFEYDKMNRLVKSTRPDPDGPGAQDAPVTQYTYDSAGNLVTERDALGRITAYDYDALNRQVRMRDAVGGIWSTEYDAAGNVVVLIDALGRRTEMTYDALNRRIATVDALGATLAVQYDAVGNVIAQTDALGRTTSFQYDKLNRLLKRTDADPDAAGPQAAPVLQYSYDAVGNVLTHTDPLGRVTQYSYDELNRLVDTQDALDQSSTLVYDAAGNVLSSTNALGQTTQYAYDALDRRVETTDALGGRATTQYDKVGNVTSVTDALGRVTSYAYDALDRQVQATDALGGQSGTQYDAVGNVTATSDALGRVTTYAYDALNRQVQVTDALGELTDMRYDAVGNLTSVTHAHHETRFAYDALDRRVQAIDALGGRSSTQYDAVGNVTSTTDALGRVTTYVYDGLDRRIDTVDALSGHWTLAYDAAGNILAQTDALGRATQYTYDALNRVIASVDALGGISSAQYDGLGNLTRQTDALGRTTQYTYDALNRRTQITQPDPDGAGAQTAPTIEVTYDAVGNVLTQTDPLGRVTRYAYDKLNRLVETKDALGHSSTTRYDAVGNVLGVTNAVGEQRQYAYDALNRLIETTDALGGRTETQYDEAGNVLSVTDALGHVTSYEYDELDRRVATVDALGGRSVAQYDAVGNVTSSTDALGRETSYSYDALDRQVQITDALGGRTATQYDAVGNVVGQTDALGRTTSFEYDNLGRLLKRTDADPDAAGPQAAPVTQYAYDAVGNLVSTVDPLSRTVRYEYDGLNRRIAAVDALDARSTTRYDAAGNVVSVTDALGRTAQFAYDAMDRLIETIDALGGRATTQYDALGNAIAQTDTLGRTTQHAYDALNRRIKTTAADPDGAGPQAAPVSEATYDAVGNLVAATDALGRVTSYEYDRLNRLTATTAADPDGAGPQARPVIRHSYDAVGNLVSTTDPLGHRTAHQYDALNRRISTTAADPDASGPQTAPATQTTYDAVGNVLTYTDARGEVTQYSYDALDRLVEAIDPLGNSSALRYDAAGNVVAVIDALGKTTQHVYDARNRRIETIDAFGGRTAVEYDAVGNITAVTDALGRVTRFGYDSLNRQTETTDALDGRTAMQYDAVGNLTRITDALGAATQYLYDALNRRVSVILADPDGAGPQASPISRFDYDSVGNLVSSTDALGHVTGYDYDALNRRIEVTAADPDGSGPLASPVSQFDYDANGNLIAATDALGRITRYEFDALNRRVKTIDADPDGAGPQPSAVSEFGYDAAGNLVGFTDPLGAVTQYAYDAAGRQITVTQADPDGAGPQSSPVTRYAYDALGNLLQVTDPIGGATRYAYDALSRVVSETDPYGAVTTFDYDAVGNLTSQTDRNGRVTEWQYDALDRALTEKWIALGTTARTISRAYDAVGRLLQIADPDSTCTYTYDALGRLISEDNAGTPGVPHVVLTYRYDAAGNLTSAAEEIAGQNSATTSYVYDALHRPVRITQSGASVADKRVDVAYNAAGEFETIRRYGDLTGSALIVTSTYEFDGAGRLVDLSHSGPAGQIADYALTLDAKGRVTQLTSSDGQTAYAYDALDQLLSADFSYQPDKSYSYDANGNRTGTGVANSGNRVLSDGTYDYAYDAEGNRIRRTEVSTGAVTEYAWDHHNRLTGVTLRDGGGNVVQSALYTYDNFDRRIATTVDADGAGPGAARGEHYVLDRNQIAAVFDDAGQRLEHYFYLPFTDMVAAGESNGQVSWMLCDPVLTVRDVVDASGALVEHLRYDSFGRITDQTNPALQPRFTYTGRELDAASGLYYYRARFYDADVGRFVSEDPKGFAAGDVNLYRYVGNNPITRNDPTGLECATGPVGKSIAVGVGGVAGVAKSLWDNTLGIVFDAGWSIGTDIDYAIQHGFSALAAKKDLEMAERSAARMKEAMDPCSDLLHTINNLPNLPSQIAKSVKQGYERWADRVEQAYNSCSLADNFKAGFEFMKPITDIALIVAPVAAKGLAIAKDFRAASALEDAASAGRSLRAEANALGEAARASRGERLLRELEDGQAAAAKSRELVQSGRPHLREFMEEVQAKWGSDASKTLSKLHDSDRAAWMRAMENVDFGQGASGSKGIVASAKEKLKELFGARSAASARELEVIEEMAKKGYKIDIRSVDVVTEKVSKLLERLGFAAKPESVKAKSYFGLSISEKGVFRGDLDIARVTHTTVDDAGRVVERVLRNDEILELNKVMNRRLVEKGGTPSFMHGSHNTMDVARGGYVRYQQIAKIGGPGSVTSFGLDDAGKLVATELTQPQVITRARASGGVEPLYGSWQKDEMRGVLGGVTDAEIDNALASLDQHIVRSSSGGSGGPFGGGGGGGGGGPFGGGGAGGSGAPRAPTQTLWRGVALTPAEAEAMAADIAAGRPILSNAARNGLTNQQAEQWALNIAAQNGFQGSDLQKIVEVHLNGSNPSSPGISLTSQRDLAEHWAVNATLSPDRAGTRPYLIRVEVPYPNTGVRQTGLSFGTEFETTFVHEVPLSGGGLYEVTSFTTFQTGKTGNVTVHWADTFKPVLPAGAPLTASESNAPAISGSAQVLEGTRQALQLTSTAHALWASAGLSSSFHLTLALADLPDAELGEAFITALDAQGAPSQGKIILDRDAAGRGWFIDATPLDASEFSDPSSEAFGRYDLFSVIAHEIGHALGFVYGFEGYDRHVTGSADGSLVFVGDGFSALLSGDGSHLDEAAYAGDLMSHSLGTFQRKLPSVLDAQIVAAARVAASASQPAESSVLIGPAPLLVDPVVNGRFDVAAPTSPSFGWTGSGDVTVQDGAAVLAEDARLNARLTQTLTVPTGAIALAFDIVDAHFDAPGGAPSDAFEFALLDGSGAPIGGAVDLTRTDASLNIQADGQIYKASSVTLQGVQGDVPPATLDAPVTVIMMLTDASWGDAATLYFDLLGFGSLDSRIVIDNVRFLDSLVLNRPPEAIADAATAQEDGGPVLIDVLANDSDPDGDALTLSVPQASAAGAALAVVDGQVQYDPGVLFQHLTAGATATDSFGYTIEDPSGEQSTATVVVTIHGANDAPVAQGQAAATDEDAALAGQLVASDVDSTSLTFILVSAPQHGSLALHADGSFVYSPHDDFSGADQFSFKASDGEADSDSAAVTITVNAVNDAPVALEQSASTDEDTPLSGQVSATDVDDASLGFALADGPEHGTLVFQGDGSFLYTPQADYHGGDAFTFTASDGTADSNIATVSIGVNPVNDAPVVANPIADATVDEDAADSVIDLAAVFADVDLDMLTLTVAGGSSSALVAADLAGTTLTLDYAADQNGEADITVRATDAGGLFVEDTFRVTVNAVNDAPFLANAIADVTVDEDAAGTVLDLSAVFADVDIATNLDGLALLVLANSNTTLVAARLEGTSLTLDYGADQNGISDITIRATDGGGLFAEDTFRVTVNAINDAPFVASAIADVTVDEDAAPTILDVSAVFDDIDIATNLDSLALEVLGSGTAGPVTAILEDGALTLSYAGDAHGFADVTIRATDAGGLFAEDTFRVTVNPVNDAPVANDQSASTDEDVPLAGVVAASDIDDASLTFALAGGPAHGTLVFNADGSFTYTPEANYHGGDAFTFTARDGAAGSNAGTVSIAVSPVNDAPFVANAIADVTVDEDAIDSAIDLSAVFADFDLDTLTLTVVGGTNPTLVISSLAGTTLTLDYVADQNGEADITIRAADTGGLFAEETFRVTVNPVNDAPVANDQSASTDEDVPLAGVVAASDIDDASLTFALAGGPAHGTLVFNVDGSFTYTPEANYHGGDGFTFTASDGELASQVATVSITVSPVNDAPEFISSPVTSLFLDAPRSKANLDSVYQAAGAPGTAVTVRFERLEEGAALETGLYRVDDIFGTVNGVAAGDDGYAAAALSASRAQTIVPGTAITLEGGGLYAFYAVLGKQGHDDRDKDDSTWGGKDDSTWGGKDDSTSGHGKPRLQFLFSIAEANADGRDRMQASIDGAGRLKVQWDDDEGRCKDGTVLCASGFAAPAPAGYRYDADAVDVDGDTLTYALVEAPGGAAIDAATGLVTWTPAAAGRYGFVIQVSDGNGGTAQQAYSVDAARRERLLDVTGTECNDQIEVSEDKGGIVRVTVNGATRFYSGLTGIRVQALGGNDQVRLEGLTASTLVEGGSGNDKLDGSSVVVAHLELHGGAGNDDLRGGSAADSLSGGEGNDNLRGGTGNDWLMGGLGKDVLFGDAGADVLWGGEGNDVLKGGCGDDWLVRGPGCDNVDGGPGADRTVGYVAFLAGTVPGLPAMPASMAGWAWDDAQGGPESGRKCRIDWDGKCGSWGSTDWWRRKPGFAGWK